MNINKWFTVIVNKLNQDQTKGFLEYNLTLRQVMSLNYGAHILKAIDVLKIDNKDLNDQAAFAMVEKLSKCQAIGVSVFKLTRRQVNTSNYGFHTLNAMLVLMKQGSVSNYKVAFSRVKGLNIYQAIAVSVYHLSPAQVRSTHFRKYTLEEMQILSKGHRPIDYLVAFEKLSKLKTPKNTTYVDRLLSFARPVNEEKKRTPLADKTKGHHCCRNLNKKHSLFFQLH